MRDDGGCAHVLLTRFNIRSAGREARIRSDPSWLTSRFELFERFCLPSVRAQSEQSFRWLVYFDVETPDDFKERIERHAEAFGPLRVRYCDEFSVELARADIRAEFDAAAPSRLITSRLDNDDGLHSGFVRAVQAEPVGAGARALNFPVGIVLANGKTYLHRDESNPFLSLSEPYEDAVTVWAAQHTELTGRFPTSQLDPRPAWLQVVHGANVSNRIRGRRVPRRTALTGFATVDPGAADNPLAIFAENATIGTGRRVREAAIAGAKRVRPGHRATTG